MRRLAAEYQAIWKIGFFALIMLVVVPSAFGGKKNSGDRPVQVTVYEEPTTAIWGDTQGNTYQNSSSTKAIVNSVGNLIFDATIDENNPSRALTYFFADPVLPDGSNNPFYQQDGYESYRGRLVNLCGSKIAKEFVPGITGLGLGGSKYCDSVVAVDTYDGENWRLHYYDENALYVECLDVGTNGCLTWLMEGQTAELVRIEPTGRRRLTSEGMVEMPFSIMICDAASAGCVNP